ncbi:F-box/LRR-repeat protein 17 [Tetrabaena socialis]|uniref:F-box/LRR-repeat protein 17 n=1 Tax=Tetrabaena socialis TaxID=47790 RepID=A0A2J7ZTM0_9CHLO|nr:F-box/LRR-repeat protein 17 [Tetrabaena socialis]|eukprot:PNH03616.1 F-box/LRR-repeat protein 17 [Tetrabaena socialis]
MAGLGDRMQRQLPDPARSPSVGNSCESPVLRLHDSLLQDILSRVDIRSRASLQCACKSLHRHAAENPPTSISLSDAVHPEAAWRCIRGAKGAIHTIITARHQQRTACDAASARRFNTGVRCTQCVPYTAGPSALRLAAALPNLQHLALHEATCCLGGMTDTFAAAVAAHCPQLASLELEFTRYSLPSELFTDAGMMALAAGCPCLTSLSLTNCGAITDRSLYAVAVHCRGLRRLSLGGYHERLTDYGAVVLFQACTGLVRVALSGKLRRVTDESAAALAAGSRASLEAVKLTRSMGDGALAALAAHCRALKEVDCCKCEPDAVTAGGVASLLVAMAAAAADAVAVTAAAASAGLGAVAAQASGNTYAGVPAPSVRVVLPRGLAAADVVAMGSRTACGSGGPPVLPASLVPGVVLQPECGATGVGRARGWVHRALAALPPMRTAAPRSNAAGDTG